MTERVWDSAFDLLMINEGGYVDNPHDKGGETKFGISKKQYPNLDIPTLTLDQAKEIYHKEYWTRYRCQHLPDCLSVCLFDAVVNSNSLRMIKILQESLGVTADGIIGNETIGACNRLPLRPIVEKFMDKRLEYLMSLKDWKYFGKGWLARVNRVKAMAERLI